MKYFIFLFFLLANQCLFAGDIKFLKGDASFVSMPTKKELDSILKNGQQSLRFEYLPSFMLCGVIGIDSLVIKGNSLTSLVEMLSKVKGDSEMWVGEGPLLLFCSEDFDLSKHRLFYRYNHTIRLSLNEAYNTTLNFDINKAYVLEEPIPSKDAPSRLNVSFRESTKVGEGSDLTKNEVHLANDKFKLYVISRGNELLTAESNIFKKKEARFPSSKVFEFSQSKVKIFTKEKGSWAACNQSK